MEMFVPMFILERSFYRSMTILINGGTKLTHIIFSHRFDPLKNIKFCCFFLNLQRMKNQLRATNVEHDDWSR